MKRFIDSIKKRPMNLVIMFVVSFLYFFNNFFIKSHTDGLARLFFVCFFNDILCPIVITAFINFIAVAFGKELKRFALMMFLVFLVGVIWESFAHLIMPRAVKDPLDMLCYMFGGLIYWGLQKILYGKEETVLEMCEESVPNTDCE